MPIQSPSGFVHEPTWVPGPTVEEAVVADLLRHHVLEAAPAADLVQSDDHERDESGDDHEELEHLVVDRAGQPAERDVGEDEGGGHDDRHPDRPADQRVDDESERVEVDAGDQDGSGREGHRVEQVRRRVEPPQQELRDAAHPRAVVERHHHDAEEHHRRHGADPVEVHGRDAVLRAVGGHAEDLDRAEVRRDEREAGHPRGQRPAGQQEVLAGRDRAPRHHADRDHEREVDREEGVVEEVDVESQHRGPPSRQTDGPLRCGRRCPHCAQDRADRSRESPVSSARPPRCGTRPSTTRTTGVGSCRERR